MTRLFKRFQGSTFAALSVPNYRLFIGGQAISLMGTWMQMAAQSWLVQQMTDSATMVGIVVALQTVPVLLLAPLRAASSPTASTSARRRSSPRR